MKKVIKWVIAGAIIIGIGLAIVLGTLAFNGWSIKQPAFEMQTYTAENDNTAIELCIGAGSVKTEFYDGDKISIEYPSSTVMKTQISENNGKFSFESKIKSFWHIGTLNIPDAVIKLPKNAVINLDYEVDAGAVNIESGEYGIIEIEVNAGMLTAEDIKCGKFDCEVNAGMLKVKKLNCAHITAEVNAGELKLDVDGVKAEYTIKADVSLGSCNVVSQQGNSDKTLEVECSAGSVKVTFAS